MRRLLIVLSAFVIAAGTVGGSQSGVRCYYDWSTARFNDNVITDSREFRNVVSACRSGRAESVPWDEYLRTARAASALPGIMRGSFRESWRRFIEMLERERDNLREVTASGVPDPSAERREVERARAFVLEQLKPLDDNRPATAPSGGTDSSVRYLELDPIINGAATQPDRFTVDPVFRSWVPRFLQEMVKARLQTPVRIIGFEGEATIRRGDKVVRLADVLAQGQNWTLRSGDVLEVTRGRLDLLIDGAELSVQPGTAWAMDTNGRCMVEQTVSPSGHRRGPPRLFLIKGTIRWAATRDDVDLHCEVLYIPFAVTSKRGTVFTATSAPSAQGITFSVAVSSGAVTVTEDESRKASTLTSGQSQTFEYRWPTESTTLDWTVTNSCNKAVDFVLWELATGQQPLRWSPRTIAPAETQRFATSGATPGKSVCYGAKSGDGGLTWGVGLDGSGKCERCCWTTMPHSGMHNITLTCPGK